MKKFLLIFLLITTAFTINGMEGQGHPEHNLTNSIASQLMLGREKRKYSEAFDEEKLSSCERASKTRELLSVQDNMLHNALLKRIKEGNLFAVKELVVNQNVSVNAQDSNGRSALMRAITYNKRDIAIAQFLIAEGADFDAKDFQGETALILAAKKGDKLLLRLLLKADANVNAKNNLGRTALMEAIHFNDEEAVKILITYKALADLRDKKGITAYDIAEQKRNSKILSLLNEVDTNGDQDNVEVDLESLTPELDDYLTKVDHELEIKKQLISTDDNTVDKIFFTPDEDIQGLLIDLINLEKKSICIAIYALTDHEIIDALIAAYKRGVKIKIIVDSYSQKWPRKLSYLAKNGIKIWVYRGAEQSKMHHKFCIFKDNINNKPLISNGSFNFTYNAHKLNYENITIRDNEAVVVRFKKQFKLLLHKANFMPLLDEQQH